MSHNLNDAEWRKSSRSAGSGQCVEVATNLRDVVAVRDTKDRGAGPVLLFAPAEWEAFAAGVRGGAFDR
ncbi:DUF397 domain-containing protein [Actinoplanes sp. NPDC051859]|uniref:DUF397 domain-containing protein n=1 Tax=Actinoplanes sp. NPDC051859 TaxID=3363909 RepID=UPI003794ABCD